MEELIAYTTTLKLSTEFIDKVGLRQHVVNGSITKFIIKINIDISEKEGKCKWDTFHVRRALICLDEGLHNNRYFSRVLINEFVTVIYTLRRHIDIDNILLSIELDIRKRIKTWLTTQHKSTYSSYIEDLLESIYKPHIPLPIKLINYIETNRNISIRKLTTKQVFKLMRLSLI